MKTATPLLKPLGDQALLAYLPSEAAAIQIANAVRNAGFSWLIDAVPAYATVGIFFDPSLITLAEARAAIKAIRPKETKTSIGRAHVIPCCYDLQLDLDRVARQTGLSPEQVIDRHTSQPFTVYAIGFSPGFPYLGYLPKELEGVPRLPSPRLRVEPGSVGLTGRQTGLYPLARPGGWNIIGRTPLEMVNVEDNYFPLQVGDSVRFQQIDLGEYERLKGNRLEA
jgi:inhibitor of KinA